MPGTHAAAILRTLMVLGKLLSQEYFRQLPPVQIAATFEWLLVHARGHAQQPGTR